jgi:hypothetical protein
MLGADFVTFFSDFTIRGEFAYFMTNDNTEKMVSNIYMDVDAEYVQYVMQLEYAGISDINFGIQLLGTEVTKINGMFFNINEKSIEKLNKSNFTTGMGTPFAMIVEKAIIINSLISLFDSRLDFDVMSLINLDDTGYLIGISAD